mmetsp:Transcript_23557/g.62018  ORF Transcript_23557/g.62018 Transcript_23557/m.62018 type:complete len:327 (+) Transcript_23557:968-1948(+)
MPLSFIPTEAPSGVRNFSSAIFRLSPPPWSSSVTVHPKTGAIERLEACWTAFAVTASTAPLKNSTSSWPVTLLGRFSSTTRRCFSSSSLNLGIESSSVGKAMSPERPAGIAVKPMGTSGPHLDFLFFLPSLPSGDLERFRFLSFRLGEPDLLSFFIFPSFSFFFLSFFLGERDRSLFISAFISSFFARAYISAESSPFSRFNSLFASSFFAPLPSFFKASPLRDSLLVPSVFTEAPSFFNPSFFTPSFFTPSFFNGFFSSSVFSAFTLEPCSSLTLELSSLTADPWVLLPATTSSSGFSCLTLTLETVTPSPGPGVVSTTSAPPDS